MANFNIKRLSEDIRREISAAVSGVKDPRVAEGFVTITRCELTNDMSYCKVWVACMGGSERTAKAVEGMTAASGYFKKQIVAAVRMRKIPELIFKPDNSLEYSEHIEEIIAQISNSAKPVNASDDDPKDDPEVRGDED